MPQPPAKHSVSRKQILMVMDITFFTYSPILFLALLLISYAG
ncbi:MAG: hypothetical protein RHS_3010 [Robinsoniella sp. RHS]|nr:MAG: hypothetical protein RHS_3010 [Robinsoniella sp. RHS]